MSGVRFDLVLDNANIITCDPTRPRAGSLAMLGGRVVGVGDVGQFSSLDAASTIDLGGLTVTPGFNDAHNHMQAFGAGRTMLMLGSADVHSVEEIVAAVAARAEVAERGTWILGSGYDHNKLAERRHPTRQELDVVSADHPVALMHTSGHFITVNTAAMRLARIGEVDVPDGGVVTVDAEGVPTGLLEEQAQLLVQRLLQPHAVADLDANISAASDHYVTEGITSATEAGVGGILGGSEPLEVSAYQRALRGGRLKVRVTMMPSIETLHDAAHHPDDDEPLVLDLGLHSGFGDDRLRFGPTKIFADGSLMGCTAAMFEDYDGQPGNSGYFQMAEDRLHSLILRAHRSGWQVATHVIGDRAVASVIDAYEAALLAHPRADHRHRLEHCGMCRPEDVARIARLGIIPVPQGRFISEIGDGMLRAIGPDRVGNCYRQRSFLDAGVTLPGSSDRPVVDGAPLRGMHAMVNQRTSSGQSFNPSEAVTIEQALQAFTVGSATAVFEEDRKGSLTAGKLADLVVLDRDLTAIDPESIDQTEVLATMVGGEFVFDGAGIG